MLAVQGPRAREHRPGALRRAAARALHHGDPHDRGRPRPGLRHRLHRRGRRRAADRARRRRRASGTSCCAAAPRPAGLAARDTLRLEACFHLYGNDLIGGARPDRGRPGLVLQGGHRLHRRRRRARRARRRPGREARAVQAHRPGHPAPGQPGRRRRRWSRAGRSRRAWRSASAWPTCPPRRPSPGPRSRSTCAASSAPPW